jgi:DNA primase
LAKEARPEAQPAEALDGWWHFFAFLRGEAELAEDCARAERSLAASNEPAEQQRLIRLTQARNALRAGEVGLGGAAGADSGL